MHGYERQPYRTEIDTRVIDRGHDGERDYVVFDDTVLYPEGGGQPADRGWFGDIAIADVQRVDATVRHFPTAPIHNLDGRLRVDWKRRFDHMQQHTAQHLLTAIAADQFGWQTTAFHLGSEQCDIELEVPSLDTAVVVELEAAVNDKIRASLAVTARRVTAREFSTLDVRSRGLPTGHQGDIRLVEIADVDRNTCGGTHVANTAEIETIALLGSEGMRGGTRLYWLAGGRVRRRLHRQLAQAAALRRAFETSDSELLHVATNKLERLRDAELRIKELATRLAQQAATQLSATDATLLDEHFPGTDAGFLRSIARELAARGEPRVVFLTSDDSNGAFFAIGAPAGAVADLRKVGQAVAETLGGRGGGTANLIQGKARSLKRRTEAAALLLREIIPSE